MDSLLFYREIYFLPQDWLTGYIIKTWGATAWWSVKEAQEEEEEEEEEKVKEEEEEEEEEDV